MRHAMGKREVNKFEIGEQRRRARACERERTTQLVARSLSSKHSPVGVREVWLARDLRPTLRLIPILGVIWMVRLAAAKREEPRFLKVLWHRDPRRPRAVGVVTNFAKIGFVVQHVGVVRTAA